MKMEKTITHYEIIDNQTKAVVGKAKTRKAASRSVDRRDNAYGAYRYSARAVYAYSLPFPQGWEFAG
jgi:hypothetical protein